MLGRIVAVAGPGRIVAEVEHIGPLALLRGTLYVPDGLSPRRLERRARKLRRSLWRQGVRRLILPRDLPCAGAFAGFGPVDELPFLRSVADLLALGSLRRDGIPPARAVVALSAATLCPCLTAAAERLCRHVRGVYIGVPGEGGRYAAWLHRQYGLPVAPPAGADVTVAFTRGGVRWGRVVELSEERTDLGGLELRVPGLALPDGCAGALMAALWERGMLERDAIEVRAKGSC